MKSLKCISTAIKCKKYTQFVNNVDKLLVLACCKLNITKIVYTSTYNVIFGGQVIENGDESLPYLPLEKVSIFPKARLYNL